jgi:hypothetical protein
MPKFCFVALFLFVMKKDIFFLPYFNTAVKKKILLFLFFLFIFV